jgi:predicted phage terminase large subunit-like protein
VQNAVIDGPATRIRLEAEKAGIVGLQFLLRDPRMHAYAVDAAPPEGDKFTRAGPVAARVNAGRLKLVRGAWNRAFLDELSTFPVGAHDDQVDALSGAYAMLAARPIILFGA